MASLNANGTIKSQQLVSLRSYGRNLALTSGANVHGQNSVRLDTIVGVPAYARSSGDFGTNSSDAKESTYHLLRFVKVAENITNTEVSRNLGQIAPDSGNQPEILLKPVSQRWPSHEGEYIIVRESDTEVLASSGVLRHKNTSVRPGGEI